MHHKHSHTHTYTHARTQPKFQAKVNGKWNGNSCGRMLPKQSRIRAKHVRVFVMRVRTHCLWLSVCYMSSLFVLASGRLVQNAAIDLPWA